MARQITIEFLGKDRNLQQTFNETQSRTSKFGSVMKTAGKAASLGLAAGAVVAGKALFDMTKGALEDQAAAEKLSTTLKNAAGATDKQVASVEDWISSMGTAYGVADDDLRPALGRLAAATGDVGKAQRLTRLAMDVSAGTGKSLQTVTEALVRAQNGSVGGLSRLGVATKDAAGKTLSLKQITAQLADTYKGQAAKQADTTAGKMARLKLILSETGEAIGYKLIPVVTKLADWFLKKALPAISRFGNYLQRVVPPIFEHIRSVIKKALGQSHGDVQKNLAAIKDIFKSVVSIIKSIWRIFGKDLVRYAKTYLKSTKEIIGGALKVIQGVFKVFSSLLKGDWRGVWQGIKEIVKGALTLIKGIVRQALNNLRLIFKVGWVAIKALAKAAWEGIKTLAQNGMQQVIDVVRSIPGRIRAMAGSYRTVGAALIGALIDGLSHAGNFATGIAGNVWDAVRGMLNSAIDKINAALDFTIHIPGPDINVNAPNIPHLAKGALVTRPTLALIGEDGPEAVVPLGAKNAPKGSMPGFGGGNVIVNISGALDPVAVGRQVEQVLIKYTRATGRALQVRTS